MTLMDLAESVIHPTTVLVTQGPCVGYHRRLPDPRHLPTTGTPVPEHDGSGKDGPYQAGREGDVPTRHSTMRVMAMVSED